ncbi:MAG TPA: hypothetical protein VKT77_14305 [Chthonomonadaceae bacterium]|nr:hypothetical protein [Chthonomonadaceae bacterium]
MGPPDRRLGLEGFTPPDSPEIREINQYDLGLRPLDLARQHDVLRLYFDGHDVLVLREVTED